MGNLNIGGGASIGTAATPAGTISLTADRIGTGDGSSGRIDAPDIFATAIHLRGGKRDNPDAINIAGSLEAPIITVNRVDDSAENADLNVTGAIGAVRPVQSFSGGNLSQLNVTGGITGAAAGITIDVTANRITVGGAITAGPGTVSLNASSGALMLGPGGVADIVASDQSTITLNHTPGTPAPFTFSRINAGATGTVNITTNATSTGIRQTGGTGLTAQVVTFSTDTGSISRTDGDNRVALNGVKALVITSGGDIALNGSGGTLDSFLFTRSGPGTQTFDLVNLGGQTSRSPTLSRRQWW